MQGSFDDLLRQIGEQAVEIRLLRRRVAELEEGAGDSPAPIPFPFPRNLAQLPAAEPDSDEPECEG